MPLLTQKGALLITHQGRHVPSLMPVSLHWCLCPFIDVCDPSLMSVKCPFIDVCEVSLHWCRSVLIDKHWSFRHIFIFCAFHIHLSYTVIRHLLHHHHLLNLVLLFLITLFLFLFHFPSSPYFSSSLLVISFFLGLSGPAALRLSAFGAKVMAAMGYKWVIKSHYLAHHVVVLEYCKHSPLNEDLCEVPQYCFSIFLFRSLYESCFSLLSSW